MEEKQPIKQDGKSFLMDELEGFYGKNINDLTIGLTIPGGLEKDMEVLMMLKALLPYIKAIETTAKRRAVLSWFRIVSDEILEGGNG